MSHLNINDEVCFLYYGEIYAGTIVKAQDYHIQVDVGGEIYTVNTKYIAEIDSKFCVIKTDPEYDNKYGYRFDYTSHPTRNKTWDNWKDPNSWLVEKFDPVQLRLITTIYGLEI